MGEFNNAIVAVMLFGACDSGESGGTTPFSPSLPASVLEAAEGRQHPVKSMTTTVVSQINNTTRTYLLVNHVNKGNWQASNAMLGGSQYLVPPAWTEAGC